MAHVSKKKTSRYYFAYYYDASGKLKSKSTRTTSKKEAIKIAKELEARDKYIKIQAKNLTKKLLTTPEVFDFFPIDVENPSLENLNDLVNLHHHMLQGDGSEEIEDEKRMSDYFEEEQQKKKELQQREKDQEMKFYNSFNISNIFENIVYSNNQNLLDSTITTWKNALNNVKKYGINNLLEFDKNITLINKVQTFYIKELKLNNSYINKTFNILKNLFNKVCDYHGYDHTDNPFVKYKNLNERSKPIVIITKNELNEYIEKFEIEENYDVMWIFLLACYLGLRRNEIANFKSSWINNDYKTVTIPSSDGTFQVKDYESRVIPIPIDLKMYLIKYNIDGLFVKNISKFRYGKNKYKWNFKLHELRKTYCSFLVYKNINIHLIMKYMGHSNLNITLKYITEVKELIDVDEDFNI